MFSLLHPLILITSVVYRLFHRQAQRSRIALLPDEEQAVVSNHHHPIRPRETPEEGFLMPFFVVSIMIQSCQWLVKSRLLAFYAL
jgi:hypothetical protein